MDASLPAWHCAFGMNDPMLRDVCTHDLPHTHPACRWVSGLDTVPGRERLTIHDPDLDAAFAAIVDELTTPV